MSLIGQRFVAPEAAEDDLYREVVVVGVEHGSTADPCEIESRVVVTPAVGFGSAVALTIDGFQRTYRTAAAPSELDARIAALDSWSA